MLWNRRKPIPDALFGDGDEIDDFQEAVERSFRVYLSPADDIETVGQLAEVIEERIGGVASETRHCATQAAFFRLRKILARRQSALVLKPDTDLSVLLHNYKWSKAKLERLEKEWGANLQVRWTGKTWLVWLGFTILVISGSVMAEWGAGVLIALPVAWIGFACLCRRAPIRWTSRLEAAGRACERAGRQD